MSLEVKVKETVTLIQDASSVVVLTGAGVSKESGIPTFRDAQTGLWANYNPEELATPQGFMKDPPLVWSWYDFRRSKLNEVEPNPGHFAIAELEAKVGKLPVITQNVDGLHQRAGSTDVVELHGSIASFSCFDSRHPQADVPYGLKEPPKCSMCDSMLRPNVVWFGESLPQDAINRGYRECEGADLILVIGTSGIVQPAASLPYAGQSNGARLVEINPEPSLLTNSCDIFLQGKSGVVLPELVSLVA